MKIETYAWIVVETCPAPASAISSILILKNCGGPCIDEAPNELGNKPSDVPSIDVGPVLVLMPRMFCSGGASPPVEGPVFLSSSADFFFLRTMRERRRWILDSVILFCWTVKMCQLTRSWSEK